jgi:hypothetical protein
VYARALGPPNTFVPSLPYLENLTRPRAYGKRRIQCGLCHQLTFPPNLAPQRGNQDLKKRKTSLFQFRHTKSLSLIGGVSHSASPANPCLSLGILIQNISANVLVSQPLFHASHPNFTFSYLQTLKSLLSISIDFRLLFMTKACAPRGRSDLCAGAFFDENVMSKSELYIHAFLRTDWT